MRVYVAGSTKATIEVNAVQHALVAAGHEITFDWTGPEGEIRSDWSDASDAARRVANLERRAVRGADALVLVPPPPGHGLGLWIETGMAIALGIPVYILGPCRESVFWYVGSVTRCETITALIEALAECGADGG